jgi:hypothetical protein
MPCGGQDTGPLILRSAPIVFVQFSLGVGVDGFGAFSDATILE